MKVTFGFFKQGNLYKIAAGDESDNPNTVIGYGKFLKYDSVDNEYIFAEHALIEGNWENTYNYIRVKYTMEKEYTGLSPIGDSLMDEIRECINAIEQYTNYIKKLLS